MIDEIKEALKELDSNVQYGICKKTNDCWDCLLVRKERMQKSGTSKMDYSYYISVRIVREDEIEEGTDLKVIAAMRKIGFKKTDEPAPFEYAIDNNEIIVETEKLNFVKMEKRVC